MFEGLKKLCDELGAGLKVKLKGSVWERYGWRQWAVRR